MAPQRNLRQKNNVFAERNRFAIRINDEFTVDVMPSVCGETWDAIKQHIVSSQIDDVTIRVLDLPGPLKTKQGLRPKDQMDASVIAAALKRSK
jgi:hypothetical protein